MKRTFPILRGNKEWAIELEKRCAGERQRQAVAKNAAWMIRKPILDEMEDEMEDVLGYGPYLR